MRRSLALFLPALLFASCNDDKTDALKLSFGPNEASTMMSSTAPLSFDVSKLRDLWVAARPVAAKLNKIEVLRIEVRAPDGSLFSTLAAPYSADQANNRMYAPPDNTRPVDVRAAHDMGDGRVAMTYPIPMSGSDYVRHPTPGKWKIKAYLDGKPETANEAEIEFRFGQ